MWGPPQQRSFQRAKELLLSAEVLAHYDPNNPILLRCIELWTWCSALAHHGRWYRALNATERNYLQLDKEGAVIMLVLKKFHKQIYGPCFVIMTDHKPLVSLFGGLKQVLVTVPRTTVGVTLHGYKYKIHYKAGRSPDNAACLSRLSLPVTVKEEPDERVLLIEELDSSPMSAAQIIIIIIMLSVAMRQRLLPSPDYCSPFISLL